MYQPVPPYSDNQNVWHFMEKRAFRTFFFFQDQRSDFLLSTWDEHSCTLYDVRLVLTSFASKTCKNYDICHLRGRGVVCFFSNIVFRWAYVGYSSSPSVMKFFSVLFCILPFNTTGSSTEGWEMVWPFRRWEWNTEKKLEYHEVGPAAFRQ